jgi:hypothetical protein
MPITEGGKFAPTQNIVSAGVFTRENDLSGLAQGVANIGGAIVAPFADGPAFFPKTMTEVSTLESTFGVADGVYYGPYTAKQYLQEQGIVTVVRVGGLTGYWQKNPLIIFAQPGTWGRNEDLGALSEDSFISVDSGNYLSTFNYQHSSSIWNITGSSDLGGNKPSGFMSASLKFSKITGSIATSSIDTFITALGDLPNISTLNSLLYTSASKGKLFSITTRELSNRFSTSVTKNGKKVDKTSGYTLAPFHPELSRVSGSLSVSGSLVKEGEGGPATHVLTFDTAWNDAGSGSINKAPMARPLYLNYLTNSFTQVGSDINYGFVFARSKQNISFYTASIGGNSTGNPGSGLSSSVKILSRYDISRLSLSGDITAAFGDISATSAIVTSQLNGGDAADLSGSILYAGKTIQIGTITNVVFNRKGVGLKLPYFYLTSSVQGQDVSPETAISTAFDESTTTTYLLSSSYFNHTLTVNTNNFNYEANTDVDLNSASFASVRISGACSSGVELNGVISGEYGKYDGTFTPSDNNDGIDACNPNIDGRQKMIVAVLANTQNASTQFSNDFEVYGFNTTTLSQVTSSTFPYKGVINPNENLYNLALKYNFVNPDGSTSSGTYGYYDFTLNESDNNYIKDVFGTNPTVGNPSKQIAGQKVEAAYNYVLFEDSIKKFVAEKTSTLGWKLMVGTSDLSGSSFVGEPLKFVDQYSTNLNAGDSQFSITNAKTPWIYSQKIAPFKGSANEAAVPTKFKLFKVHTLSDGTLSNQKYKIEISNVKLAGTVPGSDYGTFTLAVRAYSDTDKRPKYLEIFQNCNLDPNSANFIARKIGDKYAYITFAGKIIEFGTYNTLSKYIRIETNDIAYPSTCVPYGFESYLTPIDSTANIYIPTVKYSKASIYGLGPGKYPSGTVFGGLPEASDEIQKLYPTSSFGVGVDTDTKQYFKPLPYFGSVDSNGLNIDFDLEDKVWGTSIAKYYAQGVSASTGSLLAPSLSGSIPSTYDAVNESTYVRLRKFIVGFQGGFDGQWPAIPINVGSDITAGNTQGLDCTNINSPGSIGYKQAIAALGNPDEFDINLIVLPGIFREQHSYVTQLVIDMCETRQDCFYIMDNVVFPASNQTVGLIDAAINSVATIDSNYVATYYPWVKILDTNTNKIISVPPSVVLPAIYAANDNAAAEWFAPAGLNRGGITQAVQVLDRVTHSERDTLYEGRVNPIAAFPGQGICVWGQKTLQIAPSALDRINVRRLLINLKKFIASSSNYLVFEQNVAATRNRFLSIVNPYLESVQQRNGIFAFQVKMDDTNNTPDLIDRNILYGQIFIQPARTAEFIILDFNILPTGASFNV